MKSVRPPGLFAQVRDIFHASAAIHGTRQTVLEFVLIPPLLVAILFLLLFAAPILESISHG